MTKLNKNLKGRPTASEQEKSVISKHAKEASDWIKAEIQRSGIPRKVIASEMSKRRGREINETKLNQMLNRLTNNQGIIFEICDIIGVQPVTVSTKR